jgi:lipopolysaccharide exporter
MSGRAAWLGHRAPPLFARNTLLSNVAILAGGTAAGQLVSLLAAPLLTRLYAPEDMGLLGLYVAFVSTASMMTALRYDYAIVAARTIAEAAHLAVVALALLLPTSLVLSLTLLLLIESGVLGFGALPTSACTLVLLSLLVTGAVGVLRYWFVRQERFPLISGILVSQTSMRSFSQVGFGLIGLGWTGLLVGDIVGRVFGIGRLARRAWAPIVHEVWPLDPRAVWRAVTAQRKFPLFDMPSAVIDGLAISLIVPLVAQTYGPQSAGYIALVYAVQAAPVAFIGGSVADVFHARMANYIRHEPSKMRSLFFSTSGALLLLGLVPALLVMVFGPRLFELVFGERWSTAGQLAAIMAPWALAALVVSPVSRVIALLHAQELKFVYDALALSGVVATLMFGASQGLELFDSIRLLSAAQVLGYVVYFGLLVHVLRRATRS